MRYVGQIRYLADSGPESVPHSLSKRTPNMNIFVCIYSYIYIYTYRHLSFSLSLSLSLSFSRYIYIVFLFPFASFSRPNMSPDKYKELCAKFPFIVLGCLNIGKLLFLLCGGRGNGADDLLIHISHFLDWGFQP